MKFKKITFVVQENVDLDAIKIDKTVENILRVFSPVGFENGYTNEYVEESTLTLKV